MAEETPEEKIARYEFVLDAYVRELTTLREENERLRSADGAHDVLRRIYLDEAQPSHTRLKAAQASINFEKSKLENVPPVLELTAEPIRPLSEIVQEQRARADAWLALPFEERERMIAGVVKSDGNGSDDGSSNDHS